MTDTATLLEQLDRTTADMITDHRELAELLAAEKQAKVRGFQSSPGTSIKDRENDGSLQALDLTTDIFRLRGRIAGAEAQINYLAVAINVALNTKD